MINNKRILFIISLVFIIINLKICQLAKATNFNTNPFQSLLITLSDTPIFSGTNPATYCLSSGTQLGFVSGKQWEDLESNGLQIIHALLPAITAVIKIDQQGTDGILGASYNEASANASLTDINYNYQSKSARIMLAWAINSNLHIGITGKGIWQELANAHGSAYGIDIGTVWTLASGIRLGAVAEQIGNSTLQWDTKSGYSETIPATYKIAATIQPLSELTIETGTVITSEHEPEWRLGAAYTLPGIAIAIQCNSIVQMIGIHAQIAPFLVGYQYIHYSDPWLPAAQQFSFGIEIN